MTSLHARASSRTRTSVQQRMLVVGGVAAVACLWLILSWEPVAREEPPSAAPSQPEPASAPDNDPPPAAAAKPEPPAPSVAAAAEPEPEPPSEPTDPPTPTEPLFKLEQAVPEKVDDMANLPPPSASGPLADLQKEFESSARDTDSARVESVIADAFKLENVPPELLESAVCQGGICRVRTRWTPARAGGFMLAVTTLAVKVPGDGQDTLMFDRNIAVGPASDRNSNGERMIEVYLRKRNQK